MAIELPDTRSLPDEVIAHLRIRAIQAYEKGYSITDTAEVLGVCRETVSRWVSAYAAGGAEALPSRRTGRPLGSGRALTEEQAMHIQCLIDQYSPEELGIVHTLWTRKAVRELIAKEFDIHLAIRTVGKYLCEWGYTPQKPLRKSYRQDPEEVRKWLGTKYPKIEVRAKKENAEIHWGDETGVRSNCHHGRGYSRPGETPEMKVPGSRFTVNVMSTVTNQGKLRFMVYEGRMTSALFILFLSRLIRNAPKKIILILDNLSVHKSAAVTEWAEQHKDKIEIILLPKYSPELNPDEYMNCDLKGNIHSDYLPKNRSELKEKVKSFMRSIANLPERIASYFQHSAIQYAAAKL